MIDIGSVLKESQITHHDGDAVTFSIEFCKEDGSIRSYSQCRRFVKSPKAASTGRVPRSFYNLKKNKSILIYVEDIKEYRTIKISRILKFNGKPVRH